MNDATLSTSPSTKSPSAVGVALATTHCTLALTRLIGSGSSRLPTPSTTPSSETKCAPDE